MEETAKPAPAVMPDDVASSVAGPLLKAVLLRTRDDVDLEQDLRDIDRPDLPMPIRVRVRHAIGHVLERLGRHDEAARTAEATWLLARDADDVSAALAGAGLAAAWGNRGRHIESLLLAKRSLARLPESAGATARVQLHAILGAALLQFHAFGLVREQRERILELRPALSDDARSRIDGMVAQWIADEATAAGRHEEALAIAERLDRRRSDEPASLANTWWADSVRGDAHFARGRFEEADRCLSRALSELSIEPRIEVGNRVRRAQCRARAGDRPGALGDAVAAMAILLDNPAATGWENVRTAAAELGGFLLGEMDDESFAERAFDVAANAHVRRISELDRSFDEARAGSLAPLVADEAALLARCRAEAESAGRRDLAVIRRAFERAAARGARGPADVVSHLAGRDTPAVLCAWCELVRSPGGWVPLAGHLHPEVDVSHGVCPSCSERLSREMLAASA